MLPIALSSIDSATFTGAYQVITATGLPKGISLLRIINNSDRLITISYDGTTDHDVIQTLQTLQLPLQVNALPSSYVACIRAGTKIYVKAAAGTGLVYVCGYYTPQG